MNFDGYISVASITLPNGRVLSAVEAVNHGLISRPSFVPGLDWPSLGKGEIPVGTNLHTNSGRQLLVYCFGNRAPITDFACTSFGVGLGTTPPTVDDVDLESAVDPLYGTEKLKPVNMIDYPEPFIARVSLTIAEAEAQGLLLTELGLFSGNGTLLNRALFDAPINKTNLAKTFLWRLRL